MIDRRLFVLGIGILCLVSAVAIAVSMFASTALGTPTHSSAASCATTGTVYTVTIEDSQLSINDIHANRCDKLVITNADNTLRIMAFGAHDHHQPYDGVEEKILAKDQSLTVTLNQTGIFTFHDHLHDAVQGTFTVR